MCSAPIPSEVLCHILLLLPRKDLLNAATVCKHLWAVVVDIAYKQLQLSSSDVHVSATFDLLLRNQGQVAKKVRKATFITVRSRDRDGSRDGENNWIPLELLRALHGLQELALVGRPVAAGCEVEFFTALKAGALNLKIFTHIPSEGLRFSDLVDDVQKSENHPSGSFNIGQLESITWHTQSFATLDKQIIPILAASASTLTSLSILRDKSPLPKRTSSAYVVFSFSGSSTNAVIISLFSFHFPKLTFLTIGSMTWTPAIRTAFVSFLVRHHTIEQLSLAQESVPDAKRMRVFESKSTSEQGEDEQWIIMLAQNPDMLPALHRLQTDLFYLSAFAYAKVKALKRVKELEIVDMCLPFPSSTLSSSSASSTPAGVLKYLQKGQLDSVEKFSFISGMRSERTARLVAKKVADVCPNLKSWASNYWSSSVDNNTLIAYLARFPYLEEVDVSVCNIFLYDSAKLEEEADTEEQDEEDEEEEEEESDEAEEGDDDTEDEDHEDDSPSQPLVPALICADSLVPSPSCAHISLFKEGDLIKVRYTEAQFLERTSRRGSVLLRRFTVHDGNWVPGVITIVEGE